MEPGRKQRARSSIRATTSQNTEGGRWTGGGGGSVQASFRVARCGGEGGGPLVAGASTQTTTLRAPLPLDQHHPPQAILGKLSATLRVAVTWVSHIASSLFSPAPHSFIIKINIAITLHTSASLGHAERSLEMEIRGTLEGVIPLGMHPRTSIMVVLQVGVGMWVRGLCGLGLVGEGGGR